MLRRLLMTCGNRAVRYETATGKWRCFCGDQSSLHALLVFRSFLRVCQVARFLGLSLDKPRPLYQSAHLEHKMQKVDRCWKLAWITSFARVERKAISVSKESSAESETRRKLSRPAEIGWRKRYRRKELSFLRKGKQQDKPGFQSEGETVFGFEGSCFRRYKSSNHQ